MRKEIARMPSCGDCSAFLPSIENAAASEGMCTAILDEDGCGTMTSVYMDASECPKFTPAERVRTGTSEFYSTDSRLRVARGFDEK